MTNIIENLYIGDINDACQGSKLINLFGISHILTIDCRPLSLDCQKGFDYLYVHCLDMDQFDLLSQIDICMEFIDKARYNNRAVLVHCYAGQSRSGTIVTAYLMKHFSLSLEDALIYAKKMKPSISPNSGFVSQLELFESMGFKVDRDAVTYRQYKLRLLADQMLTANKYDGISSEFFTSDPSSGPNNRTNSLSDSIYKCRKCRRSLFYHSGVIQHLVGTLDPSIFRRTKQFCKSSNKEHKKFPIDQPEKTSAMKSNLSKEKKGENFLNLKLLKISSEEKNKDTNKTISDSIKGRNVKIISNCSNKLKKEILANVSIETDQELMELKLENESKKSEKAMHESKEYINQEKIYNGDDFCSVNHISNQLKKTDNHITDKLKKEDNHITNVLTKLNNDDLICDDIQSNDESMICSNNESNHDINLKIEKPNMCIESLFIEPVEWMTHHNGMISQQTGKICCPKCCGKLGSFNWSGEPCPCGHWVTPSFHIDKNKVDYIPFSIMKVF